MLGHLRSSEDPVDVLPSIAKESEPQHDMQLSQTFYVLVLLAIFPLYFAQPLLSLCVPCGTECGKCKYGVTMSSLCDDWECKKGPGELCGGPSWNFGKCGDGLTCNCNKCDGCSYDTLECFNNLSCFPHQSQKSHRNDYINQLGQSK